eukprot:g3753.t1
MWSGRRSDENEKLMKRLYWNIVSDVRGRKGFIAKIVQDVPVRKSNDVSRTFFLYRMFRFRNRLECEVERVSLKVKELLDEIRYMYRVVRDTTKIICRAELVARGYRPGSCSKMPPVARIETPPLHCMSLRHAVYNTLRECIVRMKRSSVRLKEKHHDHEEEGEEEKSKEEVLSIRALNELSRRYRIAVQLFLCDLISSVDEFSSIEGRDAFQWVRSLENNVISPLRCDLEILREILSREALVNQKTNLDTTKKKNNSKTPPTKVALRQVLLELRSHLDIMSSYVVLCEQGIMDQDKMSFLDSVLETNRLCEESAKHTESLWKSAEKLAKLIDEGKTQMMKVDVASADVVVSKRPSAVDGTWEHETPLCLEGGERDCNDDDDDDAVMTKVYTGETETSRRDEINDDEVALPMALKLNASVLGDLRSMLKTRDVSNPKQEIPVELSKKNDDEEEEYRFVKCGEEGSFFTSFRNELSSVISSRRRKTAAALGVDHK